MENTLQDKNISTNLINSAENIKTPIYSVVQKFPKCKINEIEYPLKSNTEYPIKCEIFKNNKKFYVTCSPSANTIECYIEMLKNKNIEIVIKLNEKHMYDINKIKNNNIAFEEIVIEDGNIPSDDNIYKLNEIVGKYNNICIHCMAGLGRAPLIMALILILQFNQDPDDTAIEIRNLIPNCLNTTQLQFLTKFKRTKYIKNITKCILM